MVPSPSFGFAVQMDVQIKLENEKEECVLGTVPIVSDVTRKGAQINLRLEECVKGMEHM
jgi:hypothetical protein